MAIHNFKYKHIKYERFEHLIKWFLNTYQLRDWDISLEVGVETPEEFKELLQEVSPGKCHIYSANLIAKIWVDTLICEELNLHPLEILIHELMHILVDASQIETEFDDLLIYKLQSTIFEKYTKEYKLTIERKTND